MNEQSTPIEMNARIESVSLQLDRGVFLCGWLQLSRADGTSQGFGGYVLGGMPEAAAGRHAEQPNLAAAWCVAVMRAADVENYVEAAGKIVRIRIDQPGFNGRIIAIGHALKDDRWFQPERDFQKMARKGELP